LDVKNFYKVAVKHACTAIIVGSVLATSAPLASAANSAGGKCTKAGATVKSGKSTLKCTKVGKKTCMGRPNLDWQWQCGFGELGNAANLPTRYPGDYSKLGI